MTAADAGTSVLQALDFDPEIRCEYGPAGKLLCKTGDPARWRIAYCSPCGCFRPQLVCEACRHDYRLFEIKIATQLELGHVKCVHCIRCRTHIDWKPAVITPITGTRTT